MFKIFPPVLRSSRLTRKLWFFWKADSTGRCRLKEQLYPPSLLTVNNQ